MNMSEPPDDVNAGLLSDDQIATIALKVIDANGGQATHDEVKRVLEWAADTQIRAAMLELALRRDDVVLVSPGGDGGDIVIRALPQHTAGQS